MLNSLKPRFFYLVASASQDKGTCPHINSISCYAILSFIFLALFCAEIMTRPLAMYTAGTRGPTWAAHRAEDLRGGRAGAPGSLCAIRGRCFLRAFPAHPLAPSDLSAHKSALSHPQLQSPVVFTALRVKSKLHIFEAFRD